LAVVVVGWLLLLLVGCNAVEKRVGEKEKRSRGEWGMRAV
jgi:hypothetical protein